MLEEGVLTARAGRRRGGRGGGRRRLTGAGSGSFSKEVGAPFAVIHRSSGSTPSAKFASRFLHKYGRNRPKADVVRTWSGRDRPQYVVGANKNAWM